MRDSSTPTGFFLGHGLRRRERPAGHFCPADLIIVDLNMGAVLAFTSESAKSRLAEQRELADLFSTAKLFPGAVLTNVTLKVELANGGSVTSIAVEVGGVAAGAAGAVVDGGLIAGASGAGAVWLWEAAGTITNCRDRPAYWAGNAVGVAAAAITLGAGAIARLGTAYVARPIAVTTAKAGASSADDSLRPGGAWFGRAGPGLPEAHQLP